jgi:hypothetical protein
MMRFPAATDLAPPAAVGPHALADDATIVILSRIRPILGHALPAFTKKSSGEKWKIDREIGQIAACCVRLRPRASAESPVKSAISVCRAK